MAIDGVTGNNDALEQARARQKAAADAKAKAEESKNSAATKSSEAAATSTAKDAAYAEASAAADKENADVTAAQEKVNAANVRVSTAQTSYQNATTQLSNAQSQLSAAQASGDEKAIAAAQAAVDSAKQMVNTTYQELKNAQAEATEAQAQLDKETQEATAAQQKADTAKTEAEQAKQAADTAKAELDKADSDLNIATKELEEADAALKDAEEAAEAEEANNANGPNKAAKADGTDEVTHLSQAEVEKLVKEEGYTNITSKEQFLEIFQNGGIDLNGKYILSCDVDLSGIDWKAVGNSDSPFKGVFNGNGYSIDNLTINVTNDDAQNVGFFGVTENATIENVSFTNANIAAPTDFIGGSAGVGIVAGTARGTKFDNIDISGTVAGYESVGPLAGIINDNSYMKGLDVIEVGNSSISNVNTAVDASGKYFVGGLVGSIADTNTREGVATRDLKISNCNTSGNIVFDEEAAGGLIGQSGKTIITITNCESDVNLKWNNDEDDGDLSFLMETGRAGGFVGCVDGSYIAICNSKYSGNLDVDGDFKGDWYGWYMNDAHVTIYELSGGLPVDDILNIDGIDALTPVTDPTTGIDHYEVTVSTLTGLDKMVTMIQQNPALADMITFNVNFDFEAMDGMYDPSVYAQYGVVQHLYEDEDGNVHNDVYIDNEIDMETTFHQGEAVSCVPSQCNGNCDAEVLERTMVSGLYKDSDGNYVVSTEEGLKKVNMKFNSEGQITSVTKRLDTDEVRYREYITNMVQYYQQQMYASIRALFELSEDQELPMLNKAEYKKLLKMQEAGVELTNQQLAAIAAYEVDYTVMNLVSETTHNYGCGMGGDASFLEASKAMQMTDEQGRPLFTTLNGAQLRQRMGEDGSLLVDDEGNPVYENLDGSDYEGLDEVFAQRGYPKTDEDGNFLYTDKDGNSVTRTTGEDGSTVYKNADGSVYEGSEEDLKQQLDKYNNSSEYNDLENDMKSLLDDVNNGKYPLGRSSGKNDTSETEEPTPDNQDGGGVTPPAGDGDSTTGDDDDDPEKKNKKV